MSSAHEREQDTLLIDISTRNGSSRAAPDPGAVDAVVISGLQVRRGDRTVLHDVSLRIRRGSVTGLLGPSGCGKSTLIRAIMGVQMNVVRSGQAKAASDKSRPSRWARSWTASHLNHRYRAARQRPASAPSALSTWGARSPPRAAQCSTATPSAAVRAAASD